MLTGRPFTNEADKVPSDIKERCDITEERGQERTGFHQVNPKEYQLIFEIGTQGGVKDVKVGRGFHT